MDGAAASDDKAAAARGRRGRAPKQRRRWRRYIFSGLALLAVAALVVTANPVQVGFAIRDFNPAIGPVVIAVSVTFYLLQGVRWWTLLRPAGIRAGVGDTVLISLSGQATAMLPLGELTRALLLARISDTGVGLVIATETVQELTFVALIFVTAIPGALHYGTAAIAICGATALIALIIVVLCISPLYRWIHEHVVTRTPLLRRAAPATAELQRTAAQLFRAPATYVWLWIGVLQAMLAVTLLWLVVWGLAPHRLAWDQAALVYAVTQGAGWISMTPGGLGASELSTTGFLFALGIPYGLAVAAALLFRVADKGLATAIGFGCFAVLRARFDLAGVNLLALRQRGGHKAVPHGGVAR